MPHPLLGREVDVVLERAGEDRAGVVVRGVLVRLAADGDFTIDTAAGRRYGWPALDIIAAGQR